MQLLLSCAKTMTDHTAVGVPFTTRPTHEAEALRLVLQLAELTTEEVEDLLRVNRQIALENQLRYRHFHDADTALLPAILAYTGIVFKRLMPEDFTADDFTYTQGHLNITSFLYGLLRPLDLIRNYRLEGDAVLPDNNGQSMFTFWQSRLTDELIAHIRADDGILVNLASEEMKKLFDWKRVCREVQVVTPDFRVWKDGKLKNVVIYTKMCRGEMTRYILKHRLSDPEDLKGFAWEGFRWDEGQSRFVNGL